MERPPSQVENIRPSGLPKLQSRLPGPGTFTSRTLQEATSSDMNARNATVSTAKLPPPTSNASHKHKINGLPEPDPKRKSLKERAGEIPSAPKPHLASKSSNISGFGSRLGGYANARSQSHTQAASSIRPPSRQANGLRQPPVGRPASAAAATQRQHDDQESDTESEVMSKRKGTTPVLSFNVVNGIPLRKTRQPANTREHSQPQRPPSVRSQHSGSSLSSCRDDGSIFSPPQSRNSSGSSSSSSPAPPAPSRPQHKDQGGPDGASQPSRNVSLSTAFAALSITLKPPKTSSWHRPSLERIKEEVSPSKIPKFSCGPRICHAHSTQALKTPSPSKNLSMSGLQTPGTSAQRGGVDLPRYLTKEKLNSVPAYDTNARIDDVERMLMSLQPQMKAAEDGKKALEETSAILKKRNEELSKENHEFLTQFRTLTSDLDRTRSDLHTTTTDLRQERREREADVRDLMRKHERELEVLQGKNEKERQKLERELEKSSERLERELGEAKRSWEKQREHEVKDMTSQHWDEMEECREEYEQKLAQLQKELNSLKQAGENKATESASEVQVLRETITSLQNQLDSSNATVISLRSRIATFEANIAQLEGEKNTLVSKTHFLEGNQEAQSQEFTTMRRNMEEAIASKEATLETLRKEEALRRKLNAMILELRGNIRVFVRTRPLLGGEDDPANVEYLGEDSLEGCKEMVVHAPTTQTAMGKQKNEKHNYAFDRVFKPGTANTIVFEECRELIQSVVDGYNVSILSYGQTGSGKTYGMSGPEGIIPSSIRLLLTEMARLKEKGWEYAVEASFVEVYNETLNDLLGDAKTWDDGDDLGASVRGKKKEKHEVHHDAATGKTTVTNLTSVRLWPPPTDSGDWPPAAVVDGNDLAEQAVAASSYTEKAVSCLLDTAAKNRRVAATKANERSSRSHSIFMLTLKGSCAATNESSEGVLNLVDLAGSERLKQSGAEGNRMKETQAINKSLSSLGDVIAALGNKNGNGDAHVPYRNSKLTYLLQSSLGGTTAGKSSRTLMLLHLSPLQAHWQESRSSLLFGSKVHGTHIGTARKR